jgi:hypothetical protein
VPDDEAKRVLVEHEPGRWVEATIDKQWKFEGRWRLACHYYIDLLQYSRVYDADDCRPVQ